MWWRAAALVTIVTSLLLASYVESKHVWKADKKGGKFTLPRDYECARNLTCKYKEFCCKYSNGTESCNSTKGENCFHFEDFLPILKRSDATQIWIVASVFSFISAVLFFFLCTTVCESRSRTNFGKGTRGRADRKRKAKAEAKSRAKRLKQKAPKSPRDASAASKQASKSFRDTSWKAGKPSENMPHRSSSISPALLPILQRSAASRTPTSFSKKNSAQLQKIVEPPSLQPNKASVAMASQITSVSSAPNQISPRPLSPRPESLKNIRDSPGALPPAEQSPTPQHRASEPVPPTEFNSPRTLDLSQQKDSKVILEQIETNRPPTVASSPASSPRASRDLGQPPAVQETPGLNEELHEQLPQTEDSAVDENKILDMLPQELETASSAEMTASPAQFSNRVSDTAVLPTDDTETSNPEVLGQLSVEDLPPLSSTEPALSEDLAPLSSTEPALSEDLAPLSTTEPTLSEDLAPLSSTEPTLTEDLTPLSSTEPTLTEDLAPPSSTELTLSEDLAPLSSTDPALSEAVNDVTEQDASPDEASQDI